MKAFVTGGTGFIGSHLVDHLIADNRVNEIRCLVRNREKWLSGKSYKKIEGDLFNTSILKKGMTNIDTVYHIAGVVKAPAFAEFVKENVDATENIIRVAQKSGVKKIVILSSLAAAGPSNHEPLSEDAPMRPVSMYGKSKMIMEQMISKVRSENCSITIIRPPAVYGPREEQIYTWFKLADKRICPIVGDGNYPKISLVHVSDLIEGIRLAADHILPGMNTYYITGPEVNNWNQIRKISSKILGKQTVPLYIRPGWVKKIAGAVETTASAFGVYPVLNREKANEMVLEWTCSSKKASKELNYIPSISLEEGISRTIAWYKKHHWL